MKPLLIWGIRSNLAAVLAALLAPAVSRAADPGVPSGFYLGGHVGYGFGNATATLADPTGGVA